MSSCQPDYGLSTSVGPRDSDQRIGRKSHGIDSIGYILTLNSRIGKDYVMRLHEPTAHKIRRLNSLPTSGLCQHYTVAAILKSGFSFPSI